MENYTIYKFTFSDGKTYIGQTSQPVEQRWNHGEGYRGQDVYVPIILEGWNNIQKEILHTNLTRQQANQLERHYIKKFNSIQNGYNRSLPKSDNENLGRNLGKSALILISDEITEEEKLKCQLYILKTLNGLSGNYIKLMWYFILNDQTNIYLIKNKVLTDLNIEGKKYYNARNYLLKLNWIDIQEPYLIIKYNNILKEIDNERKQN